jgi:hypothetical protein
VAPWIKAYPGYVSDKPITPHTSTVVLETPNHGVAAWWELLRKYRAIAVLAMTGHADPVLAAFTKVPDKLWDMMTYGIAAYMIGRTGEKTVTSAFRK